LKSNAGSIFGWVGIPMAWAAFSVRLIAPEWAMYLAFVVGAVLLVAISSTLASVVPVGKSDAT